MIARRPRRRAGDVDPSKFPIWLTSFEGGRRAGPAALIALTALILTSFASPFLFGSSDWGIELNAFLVRMDGSQFTSLASFDFVMISSAVLDPMADDARRRGFLEEEATAAEAAGRLAPYLFPLIGPVAWIVFRPKYAVD